jgi:hypothetical protein
MITLPPPSPTPTTIVSANPTANEIQKIRAVVQEKVQEKLKEITSPSSSPKGLIGRVIQIDSSQITIEYQNNTIVLKIDNSTVYIDQNRNKTSAGNIKIGQDILAMGISDTNTATFQTKRVVFINLNNLALNRAIVVGKIVDISKTSPIFTLIPSKNKNNLYQIKTDKNTVYLDQNQQKLSSINLKSGHKIIAILSPDPKMSKTYIALKIMDFDYSPATSPTPTPKP